MAVAQRNQPQAGYQGFYEFATKLNCSSNLKFLLVSEGVSMTKSTSYYKRIYTDFFEDNARFKLPIDIHAAEKVKRCLDDSHYSEKRIKELFEVLQLEMHFKPWNYKEDLKCIFNLASTVHKQQECDDDKTERLVVQPNAKDFHASVCEKLLKLRFEKKCAAREAKRKH